jgi:DNA helicase-2/ATP-dependent DNA helicase PcrA
MQSINWRSADGHGAYRVFDKQIEAHSQDDGPAVVATAPAKPELACAEIADFVARLIESGKVENPNQIAFLFPSLKSRQVGRMKEALEAHGLKVYAPRAGRFLEVEEARDVLGVMLHIFGHPRMEGYGADLQAFNQWLDDIHAQGNGLIGADPQLKRFVADRRAEIKRASDDYQALLQVVTRNRWDVQQPYQLATMKRALVTAPGLSETGQKLVASAYLDRIVQKRAQEGQPLSLEYILRRSTSLDWNVLDLFYLLMGFEHFKQMFDQAERNGDEGPVANLGMLTQYLQRFIDERVSLITANLLSEQKFANIFFGSYLFALYRLGESELEDADDPFPRGRIPFLTIHQSKGLEFPVVVLGNLDKRDHGAPINERIVRPLLTRPSSEPLHRMNEFDIMRMFYVALSRAKTLLVLAHFKGQGVQMFPPFKDHLDNGMPRLAKFNLASLPAPTAEHARELPRVYSFTADYLLYQKCPRQYMIFRKFGFVPSQATTMFFGSLVHRTLEDLHHELIRRRNGAHQAPN